MVTSVPVTAPSTTSDTVWIPDSTRVWATSSAMMSATKDTTTDYVARRWLHMLPSDMKAAAVVTLKPYWYWSTVNYATHGSPHDSDANVPIVFYGAGIRPGRNAKRSS